MISDDKKEAIFYCMSKINDSIKRRESPSFINIQADRLKELVVEDDTISTLLEELMQSNYERTKLVQFNNTLKNRGITL